MSDLVDKLPRWLAVQAHGDTVRLLPVDSPSSGPDVFCKLQAAADRIEQLERVLVQAREALCSVDGVGGVVRWNGQWEKCQNAIAAIDEALNTPDDRPSVRSI